MKILKQIRILNEASQNRNNVEQINLLKQSIMQLQSIAKPHLDWPCDIIWFNDDWWLIGIEIVIII